MEADFPSTLPPLAQGAEIGLRSLHGMKDSSSGQSQEVDLRPMVGPLASHLNIFSVKEGWWCLSSPSYEPRLFGRAVASIVECVIYFY